MEKKKAGRTAPAGLDRHWASWQRQRQRRKGPGKGKDGTGKRPRKRTTAKATTREERHGWARLTVELLLRNFDHLHPACLRLTLCSRVCRHWRAVALSPDTLALTATTGFSAPVLAALGRPQGTTWLRLVSTPRLIRLDLSEFVGLRPGVLRQMLQGCGAALRELAVSGCTGLTFGGVGGEVGAFCPSLRSLEMARVPLEHPPPACQCLAALNDLRLLDVSDCPGATAPTLVTLIRHLGSRSPLRELRVALVVQHPSTFYFDETSSGSCDDLVARFGDTIARLDLTNWGMHGVALLDRLLGSPVLGLRSIKAWPAQSPLGLLGTRCPDLESISIARAVTAASHVTDRGVAELALGCSNLRSIDLSRCQRLTDGSCNLLATRCPGLRRIVLKGCYQLSPAQTAALIAALTNLEEADLSIGDTSREMTAFGSGIDVPAVQQSWVRVHGSVEAAAAAWGSVEAVMGCWPRTIRTIRLAGCPALTDAGLAALRCPNLQFLDLEGCHGVTACGAALASCPRLAELNLSRCRFWPSTDADLARIVGLPHLRSLRIAHCKVTDLGLRPIAAGCWRL